MPLDSPDWQEVANITSAAAMSDGPDWQNVITPAGGGSFGGYASLTGPGQTASPGDLTQEGGLQVNVDAASTIGFDVNNSSTNSPINLIDSGGRGINIETSGNIGLFLNSGTGTGGITLQDGGTFGIEMITDLLGFFSTTPVTQPTVTGSRGGNAALASLLTALSDLGLVIDSSTA